MEEARKEYRKEKNAEIAKRVSDSEKLQTTDEKQEKNLLQAAREVAEGEQLLKSVKSENQDSEPPESESESDSVSTISDVENGPKLVTSS